MKKKIFGFLLTLALIFSLPSATMAAEFASGDEYTLRNDEVVESNLYAAGGNVTIEGTVYGDLIMAGGNVVISGTITNDLIVGGGNVTISGTIEEDVRVAGGNVTISGVINGELIATGGQILVTSQAQLNGDVVVAAGRAVIDGIVNGSLVAYVDELVIDGMVNGFTQIEANSVVVKNHAYLANVLSYKSPREATIDGNAVLQNGLAYEKIGKKELFAQGRNIEHKAFGKILAGVVGTFFVLGFIIMLLTTLVLYKFTKKHTEKLMAYTHKHFWQETLRGLVISIVLPLLLILGLVSIIGSGLSILGFMILFLFAFLAKLGGAVLLGGLLFKWATKAKTLPVNWKTITVGVLSVCILTLIPIIGWIIAGILYLAVFGALCSMLHQSFKKK